MNIPTKWDIMKLQIEPHMGTGVGGHTQLSKNKLKYMSALELEEYYRKERRPVLVLSTVYFNKSGVIECMPIMTRDTFAKSMDKYFINNIIKLHSIHHKIHGYIIPFQISCYDYRSRRGNIVDRLSEDTRHSIHKPFHDIFYA